MLQKAVDARSRWDDDDRRKEGGKGPEIGTNGSEQVQAVVEISGPSGCEQSGEQGEIL